MQFPAPSETFTSNDVLQLKKLGVDISVYGLKPKHKEHLSLISERKLFGIPIFNTNLTEYFIGIYELLKSPLLLMQLFSWILLNEFKKPKHLLKILILIPLSFYILSKLKLKKIDILHLYWGHYPSIVGFLVHKRLPDVSISIFLGAYDLEYSLGISKSMCSMSDYIFTHSKANISQFKELGIDTNNINIIHRGTDTEKFLEVLSKENKKNNLWLTAGRLLPSKGFDKVLDVFKDYKELNIDSKLLILGEGPYKTELIKKIKLLNLTNDVEFLGHLRHEEVLKYMKRVNIFILLSSKKGERLPNVIKEAMLAECICVSSVTPGIDELINDKTNGLIFSVEEYSKIAQYINSLTSDEIYKIQKNAKKTIIENFDIKLSMKKYLDIWSKK